jgi:hypothetical protein
LLIVLAEPGLRLAARGWASILGNLPSCEASIEDTSGNPKGSFVNSCIIFDGSGTHEGLIALTRRSVQSQAKLDLFPSTKRHRRFKVKVIDFLIHKSSALSGSLTV